MGARVVRIERPRAAPAGSGGGSAWDRGRRSVALDLKRPQGVEALLRLAERADVFLESFRPGVAERLGVGPDALLARNPRLVYGRLSGYGARGPLAQAAGHSLNYEALAGVIRAVGPRGGAPVPVLNLLGDFAGGGLTLAFGVVCALLEARRSGRGQVVEASMLEGVIALAEPFYALAALGLHGEALGENLFDGGAPYYAVYETADRRFVSVAAIEPHFFAVLCEKLRLDPADLPAQDDRARWPELRARLAEAFRARSRDEWCRVFEGSDACFAPVLTFSEARAHAQVAALGAFPEGAGLPVPAPHPRLSRTPGRASPPPAVAGSDTEAVLAEAGLTPAEIAELA
jgi:alpha-methylacyl-CoA racemase